MLLLLCIAVGLKQAACHPVAAGCSCRAWGAWWHAWESSWRRCQVAREGAAAGVAVLTLLPPAAPAAPAAPGAGTTCTLCGCHRTGRRCSHRSLLPSSKRRGCSGVCPLAYGSTRRCPPPGHLAAFLAAPGSAFPQAPSTCCMALACTARNAHGTHDSLGCLHGNSANVDTNGMYVQTDACHCCAAAWVAPWSWRHRCTC